MIRKFSFAKGMFSTKISLAKGIQSKTGAAHPRQKFFVCVCVGGGGGLMPWINHLPLYLARSLL